MASVTVPFPLPVPPAVTLIHGTPLTALQLHPPAACTANVVDPPAAGRAARSGKSVAAQPSSPCVTVNVSPAIASVPVRAAPLDAATTVKRTIPLPVPLAPCVMDIHVAELAAVQGHSGGAVTATSPLPPEAPTARLLGVIEYVQFCDWRTLKV